jgi:hypothetical protein
MGATGPTGATGATGATGPGVPTGGTAGQVLSKIDGTNYNTQWVTPSAGASIYSSDGTLTSNRTVTMGGYSLTLKDPQPAIILSTTGSVNNSSLGTYATAAGLLILGSNTPYNAIQFGTGATGGGGSIYVNNTNATGIAPNGFQSMVFDSNGSVHVNGLLLAAGGLNVTSNIQVGANTGGSMLSNANTGIYQQNHLFVNSGGSTYVGLNSSTGGNLLVGSANYAFVIGVLGANPIQFGTNGALRQTIFATGNTAFGSATDDGINLLQVNGSVKATQFRLSALNTAPSSSTDTGALGEIRITAGYVYVCSAANTWLRSALTTF